MCLITKQTIPMVSDKDVIVYKRLNKDLSSTFYRHYTYVIGKKNTSDIKESKDRICVNNFDSVWLDSMHYNWRDITSGFKSYGEGFHSAKKIEYLGENSVYNLDTVIVECIIPSGTKYYENPFFIVSDSIIIARIIDENKRLISLEALLCKIKLKFPIGCNVRSVYDCNALIDDHSKIFYNVLHKEFHYGTMVTLCDDKDEKWATIIEPIEKEYKIISTQKISRKDLKEIHKVACDLWKDKIIKIAQRVPLDDIELSDSEVKLMFEKSSNSQRKVIRRFLVEPSVDVDISNYRKLLGTTGIIQVRNNGKFNCKGFFLDSDLDWEIVMDGDDKVLIPKHKK